MTARGAFVTSGILLRRVDYGDHDLIVHVLTPDRGKMTLIAKSAKKSRRRFGGVLDLFAVLELTCSGAVKGRLPLLQEASLVTPWQTLRRDALKTAYASYWAELVDAWLEPGEAQRPLYDLFCFCLSALDGDSLPAAALSVLFQMRFVALAGFGPRLDGCTRCQTTLTDNSADAWGFDPAAGGLVCPACSSPGTAGRVLSRGTITQLQWILSGDLAKARRIRFSGPALEEGLSLLERFVPYHLGRQPRSLPVLRQLREGHAVAGGTAAGPAPEKRP